MEMPPQVERLHLFFLPVDAFGAHQAIVKIGSAGGVIMSLIQSNIQARQDMQTATGAKVSVYVLWHDFRDFRGFAKSSHT
jgi:hypothetical protein